MNSTQIFEIIENNIEESDFVGSISKELIEVAESMLELSFPKSYSGFLENYGAGDIGGIEIFGIIKDPKIDGAGIPNGIWLTLNSREKYNLPKPYIVISETGNGSYYVIDTEIKNEDGENPVFIWNSGAKERVADSFNDFFLELLLEVFK